MEALALTDQQRAYCRLAVQGVPQVAAYRQAYGKPDMAADVARKAAWRLLRKPGVGQHLEQLRQEADAEAVLTRQQRMQWLSARVQEWQPGMPVRPMLACIQELNRMDGAYERPPEESPAPKALTEEMLAEIERRAHLL